jgi:hypothetical protein
LPLRGTPAQKDIYRGDSTCRKMAWRKNQPPTFSSTNLFRIVSNEEGLPHKYLRSKLLEYMATSSGEKYDH